MNLTEQNEALRAQVAHLTAILTRVDRWRERTACRVDENGLIDQHTLIALGDFLDEVPAALSAATIESKTEYDVIITTPKGDISTSGYQGQTETYAELRLAANDGRNPRRLSRTVTTVTSEWVEA
jgi:hypothetical protein